MKKLFAPVIAILLMFVMALGFAGCTVETTGGGSGGSKEQLEENKNAEVEVTVSTLNDANEQDLMKRWMSKFNKANPTVNFKLGVPLGGMSDVVELRNSNRLSDICWTAGDQHSYYSGQGYFRDLSVESKFAGASDFFGGFYESMIQTTHYDDSDDGIYFVPRDYNRLVVVYNKTAFETQNIDLPTDNWTWEKFLSTVDGFVDKGWKRPLEFKNWEPIYTTLLTNYGGKYFNEGDTVTSALNSTVAETCYNDMSALRQKCCDDQGNNFMMGEGGTNKSAAVMIIDTAPMLSEYIDAADRNDWELAIAPFPAFTSAANGKGYTGAGCSGYGITSACTDAKKLEWAWKFLKYCMSEQGYNDVADLGSIVPALTSMADKGDWLTELGLDMSAFVADNTEDVFLNYYNPVSYLKHDSIKELSLLIWNKTKNGDSATSWNLAIEEYDKKINDVLA